MNNRRLWVLCALIFLLCSVGLAHATEQRIKGTVKVGIFQVHPLNFIDEDGEAQGLNPELLREIVNDEPWKLKFVPCGWEECMEKLHNETIDLMVSVAYTPERAQHMDYTYEPVAEVWGQVFVRRDEGIKSITEFAGRKVAIMRRDINGANFIRTAESLGISCQILEFATHDEVFESVRKGEADAGVGPHYLGFNKAGHHNLMGSNILFNPFPIYFASKKGRHHELLSHIDAHLTAWKRDKNSIYHDAMQHWLGVSGKERKAPLWLLYTLAAAIVAFLIFFGTSLYLKKIIRTKTRDLEESEERFRSLSNASFGGIAIHDQGCILECNQALVGLTGYEQEELIGMNCVLLFAEQSREMVRRHIRVGHEEPYEAYGLHKNGEEFPIQVQGKNVHYQGKMVRTAEFRDITERKQAERERQRLETQLVQAQKMEAIGTLAGGIAHDFNNMLGAILGYAEMAREDADNPHLTRPLDKILEAGNRAKDLVRQILTFSRQTEITPTPVDPAAIVKEAVAMLRPTLPATIDLRVNLAPDTKTVLADPTQFHQVVINLCTNAFHAMEHNGGILHIGLDNSFLQPDDLNAFPHCPPGPYACLSVADTGPGIPSSIRDRIFEPFFTTKGIGQGTGMGLATVHGIVNRYGGFIRCDSTPGQGTTFRAFFPAMSQQALIPATPPEPVAAGRGHILLVDDETILAEMGKAMLERRGYTVTACTSGIEALDLFELHPDRFDAVLTDQTMPHMTGIELARRMLALRPELPVILCTGYSNLINEEQAKAYGFKGFAMKPLTMNEVAEQLQVILGTP